MSSKRTKVLGKTQAQGTYTFVTDENVRLGSWEYI